MNSSPHSNPLANVLALSGPDGVTAHELFGQWMALYSTSDGRGMDVEILDGRDRMSAHQLDGALRSFPMIQKYRTVVLRNADELKSGDWENVLISFLDDPGETTALLILGTKLDERKSWVKKLKKLNALILLPMPKRGQWEQWILERCRKRGVSMTSDAAHYLHQWVGDHPWKLYQEIEKAVCFKGGQGGGQGSKGAVIQIQDLEETVAGTPMSSVFEGVDALFEGSISKSLRIFRKLIEEGEAPLKLLALITRHLRILFHMKCAMAQGLRTPKALAERVGVPPFFAHRYVDQARRWGAQDLAELFELVAQTDRRLKGESSLSPGLVFHRFLTQFPSLSEG